MCPRKAASKRTAVSKPSLRSTLCLQRGLLSPGGPRRAAGVLASWGATSGPGGWAPRLQRRDSECELRGIISRVRPWRPLGRKETSRGTAQASGSVQAGCLASHQVLTGWPRPTPHCLATWPWHFLGPLPSTPANPASWNQDSALHIPGPHPHSLSPQGHGSCGQKGDPPRERPRSCQVWHKTAPGTRGLLGGRGTHSHRATV